VKALEDDEESNMETTYRLSPEAALAKWRRFTDAALGGLHKPVDVLMDALVSAGATEDELKVFWLEVKHLSWPGPFGQSPWETAAWLGASLEARDLGSAFQRIGEQYVVPFRAAVERQRQRCHEQAGLKPFRVMLYEHRGDKFRTAYDCDALDSDHAAELAEAAYPGCEVISCTWFDWDAICDLSAAP
jgi:hypothetical protein